MRRTFRALLAAALLTACSSTFSRMIEQGDAYAAQGRWDEAASYYERAVQIDPEDDEARAKLLYVRKGQVGQRLGHARELLAQNRPAEALRPLFEATRLEPGNAEALGLYGQTKAKVLADAERELAGGHGRIALGLARAVLALEPTDAEAVRIEQAARQAVAAESVAAGQRFEQQGQLAAALVHYAEALGYVEGHAEAAARFAAARTGMLDRSVFHVLAAQFVGDENADELGSTVGAADLAAGLPTDLLLRVEDTEPPQRDFQYAGMRLGGLFRNYRHARSTSRAKSSCQYVCGQETVPNPALPRARAALTAAESDLRRAGGRLRATRAELATRTSALEVARGAADGARLALAAAEAAVSQCRTVFGADCSVLEAERDALGDKSRRAADDLATAERDVADARSAVDQAEQARADAEAALGQARGRLESTPSTIVVDKHCMHDYMVETVSLQGEVEVLLRGESLYDTTVVVNETVAGRFRAEDQTFPAVRGKCPELAQGDPLTLPSDADVRRAVVQSAVRETQRQIVAAYEKERLGRLERSKLDEQDGRRAEAADGAVRFVLMGRGRDHAEAEAVARIARVLGVSEPAARRACERDSRQPRSTRW